MESSPNMLTKFESKSSRAKGLAFHSKRPWILVSLHTSTIQLWDYRMGTLIDRFEEHDGPVRGIDFHKTQPLFVSGGDDYKIKVWSYQTRKCLFTLNGHLDYVRTVFFHHESPWILSASDDQTIRIWNWQNRSLICTMTGHNHYAMCAQFHPREDLVVSASLDQSVRVWDISGLRKKHSAAPQMSFEDQMARQNGGQADVFGNTDAVVKFVLEGHDRGVNWATFHPTLPLIVSAGDDRLVKLWRMNDTKAWEVDTCRGHFQNACAALFHPHQDLILSAGEDKTVRVWDLNKRTSVKSFKRENDRFWVIAAHPEINLFAAGHDNGVMVFKLERERPASTVYQDNLFYITRDKQVRMFDLVKNTESPPLLSLKRLGPTWIPPRSISYNPAEQSVLVTSSADGGTYELASLPRDTSGIADPVDAKRGLGSSAVIVARNRFAVFNAAHSQIDIKDLTNAVTKSFGAPAGCTDTFSAGPGMLLLITPTSIILYDIQQKRNMAELAVSGVKYVVWSSDHGYAALLSKHNVTIVNKALEQVSTLHETIRIKSAAWDDSGVLLYSTLNHVKYTLLNGDNGIVRTLDQTVYLVRVKGRVVICLDRYARPKTLAIDPTEYRFKVALVKRDYEEMLQIIRTSSLVGQSIIAYLQKKGYPEIALQFVQDPLTRFELAIECGDLDVALEMAKQLDRSQLWAKLGTEALIHGNHQTAEIAYQRTRSFDRLSFLYLCTGDKDKLTRMAKIAEHRIDYISQYQNSLYLGDVTNQTRVLREIEQYPLAYMTAQTYGMHDICEEILELRGMKADQISMPRIFNPSQLMKPIAHTFERNWPMMMSGPNVFDRGLSAKGSDRDAALDKSMSGLDVSIDKENERVRTNVQLVEDEEETDGWGVMDDVHVPEEESIEIVASRGSGAGLSESDLWVRTSPIAADHVAGGSFESAMQLLHHQLGAIHFAPLKPRFLEIYFASSTRLPAFPGMPPLINHIRRNVDELDTSKTQPIIPVDLDHLISEDLEKGFTALSKNELSNAMRVFIGVLYALMVNAVLRQSQAKEAQNIITTVREYALAISIELARRSIEKDDTQQKRNLELAAYFTIPKLQPQHRTLALRNAMKLARDAKNLASALSFANRILQAGVGGPKLMENARKTKALCERNPSDSVDLEFDQYAEFDICARSFTPLYAGADTKACPFDGSMYHARYKGMVCAICQVAEIGALGSGLRLSNSMIRNDPVPYTIWQA